MFCPQCGVQVEQQTKFCKSCGLKLADHAQLIAAARETEPERLSPAEAKHQLRWLKGSKALTFGALLTPLLMIFIGIAASERGPEQELAAMVAFAISCLWLGLSGRGIYHLLRSGFFKTYKERRIRAEAALLAQPATQPREAFFQPPTTNRISHQAEPVSIVEPTTRELRTVTSNSGKIH